MILAICPKCHSRFQAPETFANKRVKCPQCQALFTVPNSTVAPAQLSVFAAAPTVEPGSDSKPLVGFGASRGWRYLSLPWVVMTFLFGFLPWCEVSCNSKEIEIRLTQSGYQALYGGVSAPPAMEEMLAKEPELSHTAFSAPQSLQEMRKKLEVERSYLANVSPFLIFFWIANFALLDIICFVPLGGWRLGFALPLCGVMLIVLILHACLGLPLEHRVGQMLAEAVREDAADGMFLLAVFKTGKTFWFWLTLALVILLAMTEPILNWLRAERWSSWHLPGSIAGGAAGLMLVAVIVQFALREVVVSNLENRISQLRKAEEEKRQLAEAVQRQQEAEAERLRQQAALKEAEARRLEQSRLREQEEEVRQRRKEREQAELQELLERRRQEAEARQKAEQQAKEEAERQAANKAEADRKAKAEAEREAARKEDLEKKGLPYYPHPRTYESGHNAEEWYQLLRDNPTNIRIYRQATAALTALNSEGIPYLIDYLNRQMILKNRHAALRLIQIEYVHRNDLHKILSCLDRDKNLQSTRLLALQYLEKRAKDIEKRLVQQIERLVDDMLDNPRYKEETKEEIRSRLKTIRREANSQAANHQQ